MEIGAVIKKYRTKKNITQEEMAKALSVTPQAVSRWETGLSYPDIAMIPEIVKYLDVSADELLGSSKADERNQQTGRDSEKILNQNQIDCIFDYTPTSVPDKEPKTVLVVDDSKFMRIMLQEILSQDSHKVLQAKNGEECLERLQTENIDVCILDIMMPGINGLEILKGIKKSCPKLKVIMLSAQCTEKNVKKALELGADYFVAKPFVAASVSERI